MMKKLVVVVALAVTIMAITPTCANATVEGITKDNYADWVKPYPDAYGYNIGECDRPYLDGEEYFYDEYIDHWNVDRVYDPDLVPKEVKPAKKVKAKATKSKKVKAKKVKKSKKSKKSRKVKKY